MHIVQVHELGRQGDLDFIVMEYVENLFSQVLHARPLPPPARVAELGCQVAKALSRAHRKGLLHRDLKPSNILITLEEEAKVVDFGLATLFERQETSRFSVATTESLPDSLGRQHPGENAARGSIVGTLPYMSPEQLRSEPLDARSDIFSLGAVLYEMTTGRRPFTGASSSEVAKKIQDGRPSPVHELVPEVPIDLERTIHKALSARRGDRYQTMDDLAVNLRRLARDVEFGLLPLLCRDTGRGASPEAPMEGRRRSCAPSPRDGSVDVGLRLVARNPAAARTILTLPMEVHGQTDGAEYLGHAFAESLAVNLAQARESQCSGGSAKKRTDRGDR